MARVAHIKDTFKHALIFGSAGLIGKVVGFVMLPLYAHHLGDEGYGVIGMIDVVLSGLTLLIGYGFAGAMSRFYYETADVDQRKMVVSTSIILMFLMVIVVTLPVLILHDPIAYLAFGRDGWGHYIVLAVIAFMAEMTAQTAENYIVIRQESLYLSILSLGKLAISLPLNVYLIAIQGMGVEGYLYASVITGVIYTLVMHVDALRRVGLVFDREIARRALAFSLPLLPGYVAMFIRGSANSVILRVMGGLALVGVFEMLFKFVTLIGFFAVEPFSKIWQVKRFEVCDLEGGPAIMARVFTYHTAVLLFLALLFSLEIPLVLRLLTPPEFWLSGFIVFLAVMGRVALAAYYHMFFGLLYAKKTFKISIIQMITAVVNLGMSAVLISLYDIMGAVVATFLFTLFQCVIAYLMARPYFRVPFEWNRINQMLILTVGLYWVAKDFSIRNTGLDAWVVQHLVPSVKQIGIFLHFDRVWNGKIMLYLVDGAPLVTDGFLLFLYSGFFIIGLLVLRIIPGQVILDLLHSKNIRRELV